LLPEGVVIKFSAGKMAQVKELMVFTLIVLLSRFSVYLLLKEEGQSLAFQKASPNILTYLSFAGDGVCGISAVFGICSNRRLLFRVHFNGPRSLKPVAS
jgi:hypothetical protein